VSNLLEICRARFSQHQYVVATHSPYVIFSAAPEVLLRVGLSNIESLVSEIDRRNTAELQSFLSDIGARLSDVFGADQILWVEGATEEACFPIVIELLIEKPLLGTAIVGVKQTSDLLGRK